MTIRPKLLVTAPYSSRGGVHSFVKNISPCLNGSVLVFKRGRRGTENQRAKRVTASFVLPFRFMFSLFFNRPDYVIINTSLNNFCIVRDGVLVCLSKFFLKKVLLIIHGFEEDALSKLALLKMGFFRADGIIVLASTFKKLLVNAGFKKQILLQHNPVPEEVFLFQKKRPTSSYKSYKNVLFMARVEKAKGVFTAINAFHMCSAIYPDVKLFIAGDGGALKDAQRHVSEHSIKNVFFVGFLTGKEKHELLNKSDIFLFPTEHKEGLPINVLEAMAAGQIIITRPVAGLQDLFRECTFGIVTSSTEPNDFAKAISDVLRNKEKYSKIRTQNAAFANNNFQPKVIAKKIDAFIQDI